MKYKNGNISNNCYKLKICHINKQNSHLKNKIPEIRYILDEYSPDILCIAEANVKDDLNDYIHEFTDYSFELNLMHEVIKIFRNIILIRKGIIYRRQIDLESSITCNIWIEMSMNSKKRYY